MQSRYYNPEMGRFINGDSTDVFNNLTKTQDDLIDVNLFVYCLNNRVNMADPDGHFAWVLGGLYFIPGISQALLMGTLVVVAVALTVAVVVKVGQIISKAKIKEDPYARPGQKKQGRESKEKKRNDDWKGNPNKRPQPPKKSTPGKSHQKYPQ